MGNVTINGKIYRFSSVASKHNPDGTLYLVEIKKGKVLNHKFTIYHYGQLALPEGGYQVLNEVTVEFEGCGQNGRINHLQAGQKKTLEIDGESIKIRHERGY